MALSRLEKLSCEILEEIVLYFVAEKFLGPPGDLFALLQVSRHIWKTLSLKHHPFLYARIFSLKFDTRAPLIRFGDNLSHSNYATSLMRRCQSLKRLRRGCDAYSNDATSLRMDLWTAYSMFLESDGKNARQLVEYAKVDRFASDFVSLGGRLHYGLDTNGGWTVDNEENSVLLWILWYTEKWRVPFETPRSRHRMMQALAHYFIGTFKYPSTYAPVTSGEIPTASPPPTPPPSRTLSLAASPIYQRSLIPNNYGPDLVASRPLLIPPALLCCAVRLEAGIAETNWRMPDNIPATRAAANAIGWQGPTLEDHATQKVPSTRLVEWENNSSERHQHDWRRLLSCYDPWSGRPSSGGMFTPGMLDGVWNGRWFGFELEQFKEILHSEQLGRPTASPQHPMIFSVPMKFTIREHHQRDKACIVDFDDISTDGTGEGVFNAWFPDDTSVIDTGENLEVHIPSTGQKIEYKTYCAAAQAALDAELAYDSKSPFGDGIWDIILTAKTDHAFGEAWGHKQYYGRVRAWDGLIVLAETEGQWIFRGYLHGMQNLVGIWRETWSPINVPGWEGVWSMVKVE